jgi:type I restriction enzyme, S subunit
MKGWQTKTLGEACQIKPPKAEARRKLAEADLVSFAPMEDLGIGQKFLIPMKTRPLSEVAGSYTYFANGDVLLAKITPCFENGKLGIAADLTNGIGFGSSEYLVFRPTGILSSEWLYYFLDRQLFRDEGAQSMTGAVGHKRVAKEFVENYPIPVPPLPEQHRIVAILDAAFDHIATARANCEANLLNARAIFESHLQAVFTQRGDGWEVKSFDEVLVIKNGRDQKPVEKIGGKYPIYGSAGNVMGWTDSFICDEQTTIIGRKGTINKPLFIETKFWNVDTAFGLAAKPNLNAKFLYFFCLSYDFSSHNRGTTIPSLVKTDLLNIKISIPSLSVQEALLLKFTALHKETQRLASLYQRKLQALDDLKKSLLHQAFSGLL